MNGTRRRVPWLLGAFALWLFTTMAGWAVAPALCDRPAVLWGVVVVVSALAGGAGWFGLRGLARHADPATTLVMPTIAFALGGLAIIGVPLAWILGAVSC